MKTNILTLIIIATASLNSWSQSVEMEINTTESSINWLAKKVTGQHEGNINLISGNLEMTENKISGGSFKVDMTSIVVTDLSGEYKGKLEGHLKSKDFFGIEKFPIATLAIKKAIMKTENHHEVTADMHVENNEAMAKLSIDRTKYDIRYRSNSFFDNLGDIAINNEFELDIKLKF